MSSILITKELNALWVRENILDNSEKQKITVINGGWDGYYHNGNVTYFEDEPEPKIFKPYILSKEVYDEAMTLYQEHKKSAPYWIDIGDYNYVIGCFKEHLKKGNI